MKTKILLKLYTSYLHEQDLVSVFLTLVSVSRGLREVKIISKHKLFAQVEELKLSPNGIVACREAERQNTASRRDKS